MLRKFMAQRGLRTKTPLLLPVSHLAPPVPPSAPVRPLSVARSSGSPRLFSPLGSTLRPYCLGPVLSRFYVNLHQEKVVASKQQMKLFLACEETRQKDLFTYVDLLFDFEEASKVINKVDAEAKSTLNAIDPKLFSDYARLAVEKDPEATPRFLQSRFLPALRKVFQTLAEHYGFDPQLAETSEGVLLDEDYLDFVRAGKMILDLGEDGHGPLPHMTAAFMMKELEKAGHIHNARSLYQALAEKSKFYCAERVDYTSRFLVLLDFPHPHLMSPTVFCNPSSLSNHLLHNGETLKQFARLCKKHSDELMQLSSKEWEQRPDKPLLTRGKIMRSAP